MMLGNLGFGLTWVRVLGISAGAILLGIRVFSMPVDLWIKLLPWAILVALWVGIWWFDPRDLRES